MADPMTAYRWCDHTLAMIKGVLGEVVDRLRDAPENPKVREQEDAFLIQNLEDSIRAIEDCLYQAREEAFDVRAPFTEPFFRTQTARKRTAALINKQQQAG